MKALILYFSYSGNTKKIAERIHSFLPSDREAIKTLIPYSKDYDKVVEQGQREVDEGYCPRINPIKSDLSLYDVILLGTPVWWYTYSPAVRSFLKEHPLKGKRVYPFATNEGWIGHTEKDLKALLKDARVYPLLNVRFDKDKLVTEKEDIRNWIQSIQ